MTAQELATLAKVSVTTVYKRAKELGRLPTLDELKKRKHGRPQKWRE